MNPKVGIGLVALGVAAAMAAAAIAVSNHEADLSERCAAAGGRRVDVGVGEKLCFGEGWRWIQI